MPRIEYAGAVYHVMCRGDRREPVVRDEEDYALFLATLAAACARTGWCIHSYVIMPNHYHLFLETPEANLVVGMKWLQGTYTQRFNVRHRENGHLFQGRYKALVLDGTERAYFRLVSDYIHLNPARAHLLDKEKPRLADYPWSSYNTYVGLTDRPAYLQAGQVLWSHGWADNRQGRRAYGDYLSGRVAEIMGRQGQSGRLIKEWKAIRRGGVLAAMSSRADAGHVKRSN